VVFIYKHVDWIQTFVWGFYVALNPAALGVRLRVLRRSYCIAGGRHSVCGMYVYRNGGMLSI